MSDRFYRDSVSGSLVPVPSTVGGEFSAQGEAQEWFWPKRGDFSFSVEGTFAGSLRVMRSSNLGKSWVPISASPGGGPAAWTQPGIVVLTEPEAQARYRVECTAITSGTAEWRFGQ